MAREPSSYDLAALADILHSGRLIAQRIEGRSLAEFERDEDFQDLIVLRLLYIGEAARRLSRETESLAPGVPWPEVRGMRNRLIHGYDSIDPAIVWETAREDVPRLVAAVERLIAAKSTDPA